jgi:selenocysteine-specific elongation factor
VLHREAVAISRRLLTDYLRKHSTLESGNARTLLGTTRKYAIPILEYWDAQGLTRRVGNTRQLRETTEG